MNAELIRKYNIPGPRYTSYPTVPFWDSRSFKVRNWRQSMVDSFWAGGKEISVYIHLPFCESLCTYCGCNTRITKNHGVEGKYMKAVLQEWDMYLKAFPVKPVIRELHLGGGTPTFFSPENLKHLVSEILKGGVVPENPEYAFEGHPSNTTKEHLKVLYELGFRRVSFGIQDFDKKVQLLIHRIQPFKAVEQVTETAREIGYTSINFDLIYGLPGQKMETVADTISKTITLRPDRIAFYSYAHIPHIKPAQKPLETHLPDDTTKRALYEMGKSMLMESGYEDIGMDHFALKTDALYKAHLDGSLHRNFMGYSLQQTQTVIGLGVSAIGDTWGAFVQNVKKVEEYYELIDQGDFPVLKGHDLTQEDLIVRKKILDLICRYETGWTEEELHKFGWGINFDMLDDLKNDGLIEVLDSGIRVLEEGKPFIRNICMALDVRMWEQKERQVTFSKTV